MCWIYVRFIYLGFLLSFFLGWKLSEYPLGCMYVSVCGRVGSVPHQMAHTNAFRSKYAQPSKTCFCFVFDNEIRNLSSSSLHFERICWIKNHLFCWFGWCEMVIEVVWWIQENSLSLKRVGWSAAAAACGCCSGKICLFPYGQRKCLLFSPSHHFEFRMKQLRNILF